MANRIAFLVPPTRLILILLVVMCLLAPAEAQHGGGGATPQADILEADALPAGTRAGAARVGGISAGCTLVLEIDLRGRRGDLARWVLRLPRAICRQN